MDKILNLYLLAPKGYEMYATIVVAPDEETATAIYSAIPQIEELLSMGAELILSDVSTQLLYKGYTVNITKTGVFH